jgi:hypothetical protein
MAISVEDLKNFYYPASGYFEAFTTDLKYPIHFSADANKFFKHKSETCKHEKVVVTIDLKNHTEISSLLNALAGNEQIHFKPHGMIFMKTTKTIGTEDFNKWVALFEETKGLIKGSKYARRRDKLKDKLEKSNLFDGRCYNSSGGYKKKVDE